MSNHSQLNQGQGNSPGTVEKVQFPSLHGLTCPKCHGDNFVVRGTKGSRGASFGVGAAFGAIGNLVANSINKNDLALKPVQYKCKSCGHKFESLPLVAKPEELLDAPCTINFTRASSFVGMAVAQHIWLNGLKVAPVSNGKTVTFQTYLKHNTIFVTDHMGVAFKKGVYKFDAQSGGTVNVRFKRKFV